MNFWYLHSECLGKSPSVTERNSQGQVYTPYSVVYVCPRCAHAWGHIFNDERPNNYRVCPRECEIHGCGFLLPYQYDAMAASAPPGGTTTRTTFNKRNERPFPILPTIMDQWTIVWR